MALNAFACGESLRIFGWILSNKVRFLELFISEDKILAWIKLIQCKRLTHRRTSHKLYA